MEKSIGGRAVFETTALTYINLNLEYFPEPLDKKIFYHFARTVVNDTGLNAHILCKTEPLFLFSPIRSETYSLGLSNGLRPGD